MNCHYCGTTLHEGDAFCRYCGTRREDNISSAPVQPAEDQIPPSIPVPEAPKAPTATVYKEKTFDWHPYGAPEKKEPLLDIATPSSCPPKLQLPVKRGLLKMILLGIVTLGIYPVVIWSRITGEVNMVASRYDGERNMSFFGMCFLAPLTLGIVPLVWMNKLCRRIGDELQRRGIDYRFGSNDFWLWCFLLGFLSTICNGVCAVLAAFGIKNIIVSILLLAVGVLALVGPFIFLAKLMKAMNFMNKDYNLNG